MWAFLGKALAAKGALESARGGVSKGGNPLGLYGAYKGISSLAGNQTDENNGGLIPGVDRPPRVGLEGSGRTGIGLDPSITDDQFWLDTDF